MNKVGLSDPEHWLPREMFAAYCGSSTDKLVAYYDKAKARRKVVLASFDPFALFLLPAWLGYRRQWTLWSTLVGSIAVVTLATGLAHVELPAGAFVGGVGALGFMAHGLLLTNANGLFAKLKRQGLDDNAIQAVLANKAKPSAALACAALIAALAVQACLVMLLPD